MRTTALPLAMAVILTITSGPAMRAELGTRVAGNLVFWDQARGFDAITANADVLSEVSPFWYRVLADGRVVPYTTSAGGTYEDPSILTFLRANGIQVIPTVANIIDGRWDGQAVSRILRDATLRALNIDALVQLAVGKGYDGIDLDYEDLPAADRSAFSAFVSSLASALHARGKVLSVNVYAKTSEPGTWSGPQAQDWRAIGQAADQVRIMAYEYHWSSSGPGPIAPVWWVRDVLAFARTAIPADRITHGLPLYGYDWVGQSGVDTVWSQSMALASQHGATIRWDAASGTSWFEYTAQNTRHTVWFENGRSTDAKLQAAADYRVSGVALWRLGGEDPATWTALRTRLGSGGGGGGGVDTVSPSVTITAPANGSVVSKKQTIGALATDNVAVARVEFFVDNRRIASDTTTPYSVSWNSQPVARGTHVITAVAYDTSGNHASASVTVTR